MLNVLPYILILLFSLSAYAQDETETEETTDIVDPATAPADTAAEDESATVQIRVIPNPAQRRMLETVKHLNEHQREFEVIKFSDEESSISGLYLPENTGRPQGGILILHDIDQHAHWPHTVSPLREYLPDYGWNTLSLFFENYISSPLPIIPETKLPSPMDEEASEPLTSENEAAIELPAEADALAETGEADEAAPQLDDENFDPEGNTDALDEAAENFEAFTLPDSLETATESQEAPSTEDMFLQTMLERVEGGLRQLNTLGQFNLVIIAHGLSANWAVETLRSRFEENPELVGYSLILIDAKSSRYPQYQLNETLSELSIPILDLHTNRSQDMKREVLERKNTITRKQKAKYMQIRLPSISTIHGSKHNMISRRVRGWLQTHAAGEEVTVKERGG